VKAANIASIKSKSFKGTEKEWEFVLGRSLLHASVNPEHSHILKGLQLVAKVSADDSYLELVWQQKNRSTIVCTDLYPCFSCTVLTCSLQLTLGSVRLEPTEDEFDLFTYIDTAILSRETTEEESESLEHDLELANAKVAALEKQLKDLTEAKLAHENILLSKFSDIINTKKLKIRDQQRLITTNQAANTANSNSSISLTRNMHANVPQLSSRELQRQTRKQMISLGNLPSGKQTERLSNRRIVMTTVVMLLKKLIGELQSLPTWTLIMSVIPPHSLLLPPNLLSVV
jgi:hypothetical protein